MSERQKQHHGHSEGEDPDTKIRGRDFRGTSFAADQHEQTEERNDVARRQGRALDEAGEPVRDEET